MKTTPEQNKRLVLEAFDTLFNKRDYEAAERYCLRTALLKGQQMIKMTADILSTRISEGIAVITLGSAKRMYFDAEMSDALAESLQEFASDPNIRVVIVTGGTPGYFNRHYSIPELLEFAEAVRASGRQWPDNATYHGAFFDKANALCETMPKPVIAAISGTALAGAFEFTLACDIRIAEDGDYLIGLPESELGVLPGGGGPARSDQRRP